MLKIRKPEIDEAPVLSALARRSKGHWGYSETFLDECQDELKVTATKLRDDRYRYFVATSNDCVLGYYALFTLPENTVELEAMFVEPAHIGTGTGRQLMRHALQTAKDQEFRRMLIQSDPNAAGFYLAAGAVEIGRRESGSVPGRYLPLLEIRL